MNWIRIWRWSAAVWLVMMGGAVHASGGEVADHQPGDHNVRFQEEIEYLYNEIADAVKNQRDKKGEWDKYLQRVRNDAERNRERVDEFKRGAAYHLTIKKTTTFLKEGGGFEYTPICVVLPVKGSQILVGERVCTTPSSGWSRPAAEFIVELDKEVDYLSAEMNRKAGKIGELKGKQSETMALLAAATEQLATLKREEAANYSGRRQVVGKLNEWAVAINKLSDLINAYVRQLKDIDADIKRLEKELEHLKVKKKYLVLASDFIHDQVSYYDITLPKAGSVLDRLRELDAMRREGLITEADYQRAKERILKEM